MLPWTYVLITHGAQTCQFTYWPKWICHPKSTLSVLAWGFTDTHGVEENSSQLTRTSALRRSKATLLSCFISYCRQGPASTLSYSEPCHLHFGRWPLEWCSSVLWTCLTETLSSYRAGVGAAGHDVSINESTAYTKEGV